MHRVFAPEPSIDLEIVEAAPLTMASPAVEAIPEQAQEQEAKTPGRVQRPRHGPTPHNGYTPLLAGLALIAGLMAATAVAGLGIWSQHQQALQQERNMLLIERLRNLGGASEGSAGSAAAPGSEATGEASGSDLPPPPPEEPWMEELATLPRSSAPAARVLQVPMVAPVQTPAPAAQATSSARPARDRNDGNGGGSLPSLVGVIQIPGRSGAAIFQVNGSSTSAAVGEAIGSSGWRLRSASGESAVIERGSEQRRLNIGSGM